MFEQINKDLTESTKAKDTFRTSVLRMLKSAIIYEKTNGEKHDLTDEDISSIIKKQVKMRKSSMEEYISYNRQDLADSLEKEIELLNTYLPKELSEDEINKIIDEAIKEINPDGMKGMGLVIKAVKEKCGVSADMTYVSKTVKEKLSNL